MYRLDLKPSAARDLDRVQGTTWQRLKSALLALRDEPRPPGCIRLSGAESWRIRVGDWRVIYDIDDADQLITVLRVKHRRDAYRDL
jgi:mRNA interferase RelE/StbE